MSDLRNEKIDKTIYIDGDLKSNPTIVIGQTPYLLEKYDFDKIIHGNNYIGELKKTFIGITIGLLVNMIAKFFGNKIDKKIVFDNWEVYAFIISLIIFLILVLIDFFVKTERKKIIRNIKNHFKI